jgi:hypothetical protein
LAWNPLELCLPFCFCLCIETCFKKKLLLRMNSFIVEPRGRSCLNSRDSWRNEVLRRRWRWEGSLSGFLSTLTETLYVPQATEQLDLMG